MKNKYEIFVTLMIILHANLYEIRSRITKVCLLIVYVCKTTYAND